ncbi:MAG: acyltransferase [Blautia producta]
MFRKIIKRMIYKERASSESYISYLRKKGIDIGEDCIFYSPKDSFVDVQYPWMINIGNHVRITKGVMLITHDFSWSVLKKIPNENDLKGNILGASGKITIGNNVFIGINTIITRNVNIGDNVIIGAGSIVTKDCPSNGVYAGNPAHYIMSVDEFYIKRKKSQVSEAKELVLEYKNQYGKTPEKKMLNEYFMLFEDGKSVQLEKAFIDQMSLCGNFEESIEYIQKTNKEFHSYEEFLEYCLKE